METGMSTLEFRQRFSVVSCRIVEDGDDWTTQVSKEVAEEHAHLVVPDIVEIELVERPRCWRFGLTETPEMTEILSRR